MTIDELKLLIDNDTQAKDYADAGDYISCAERCMEIANGEIRTPTMVTSRGIVAAFSDPTEGETVMQIFEQAAIQNPVLKRALTWLEPANGGVDIGAPATRALLDSLATLNIITSAQTEILKALAVFPPEISHNMVAEAIQLTGAN